MNKSNVKVEVNWLRLKQKEKALTTRAIRLLKNEIVSDTDKYVPYKSGATRQSARNSIYSNKPQIVYEAKGRNGYIYTGRLYEGYKFKFKTIGTRAGWVHYSKSLNKDKWIRNTRRVYRDI